MTTKDQALDLTEGVSAPRPATAFSNAKVWRRADLSPSDWTVPVTAEVRDELEAVVTDLRRQPMPVDLLDPAEFDMDASRAMMAKVTAKVRDGIGGRPSAPGRLGGGGDPRRLLAAGEHAVAPRAPRILSHDIS